MDVEKLQKINALANELRKHNFAKDNNDAFSQAEQVYEQGRKKEPEQEIAVQKMDDTLMEQKFQMLLQMHLKKYEEEIANLKQSVIQLNSKMEQMKTAPVKAEPAPKERQEPLKTQNAEPHPKRGNYTSADVDVQKMFYFGNKR